MQDALGVDEYPFLCQYCLLFLKDLVYLVLSFHRLLVEKKGEASFEVLEILLLAQHFSLVLNISPPRLHHPKVRLYKNNLAHILLIVRLFIPR